MPRSFIYEFAQKQFITTHHSIDQLNDKDTKKHCLLGNNSDSFHAMTNQLIENILTRKSVTLKKKKVAPQKKIKINGSSTLL